MAEPTRDTMAQLTLRGIAASPGIGVGPAVRVGADVPLPPDEPYDGDLEAEATRAEAALKAVADDLASRAERVGGEAAAVLEAQAMMASDPGLVEDIGRRVRSGATSARAVFDGFGTYRELLAGAGDYLAARVADLDDIRDRAVAQLLGLPLPGVPELAEASVLVARDLAPADTALLDPTFVAAFVTEEGGPTSHTAIIARSMGVPAVVACGGSRNVRAGVRLLVDGSAGVVLVEPSSTAVDRAVAAAQRRAAAAATATGQCRTADGHAVALLANVGGVADATAAAAAGAEGIGLFRTEFVFLDRSTAPSEDEQVALYRDVLAAFSGRRVVARVLDAGADKPLAYLHTGDEPNPALGVRGLRMLLAEPDVLAGQLRALGAAAAQTAAELEVMAPMVADAADTEAFVAACRAAGLAGPAGVMVEIPSAALRAASILRYADFLSIGTNDLAQYAFAADRQVGALARYQDPWQPALLDLIAAAGSAAHAVAKHCGVCGEAAADPVLACVLVGLGVTSLSMSPPALSFVRSALGAHTLDDCRAAATAARGAESADEARTAARAALPHLTDLAL